MEKLNVRFDGISPMLMHNKRTCNPRDPYTVAMREITSKRKKTDADLIELSKLEFMAGLYMDENEKYFIPPEQIEMMIASHANAVCKVGKNSLIADLAVEDPFYFIEFDGPKYPSERFADPSCVDIRSVRIQKNRVMRTRPVFKNWVAEGTIFFSNTFKKEQILKMLDLAQNTGLGDFRPKFGRFIYTVL